jgi:ankyrin repeat protein
VFCQLDTLRQCLPSSVRPTLEELPESLDETYERIVKDIKKSNIAQAYRLLQCLVVAIRPLSVAELAELLAFDFTTTKGGIPELNPNWRWEDHEQAILSTCSSLITILGSGSSGVVQFSHFSVKEFLMSDRLAMSTNPISRYHIVFEDANTVLTKACLGVLLRDPIDENDSTTDPLAVYAASNWVTHAQVGDVASRVLEGMQCLFDPDKSYFSAWVKLSDIYHHRWAPPIETKIQQEAAPLYYAAYCGFHELIEHLASKYPQYTNAISGNAGTALHSASYTGHVRVVRSLLKCGAEVDSRGVWNQSPLIIASSEGHLNIVQCLTDHGADVNLQDDHSNTPLRYAAVLGNLEMVRTLLAHGADVNFQDDDGWTPLYGAFWYAHAKGNCPRLVRLLLEHGADPNARDNKRRMSLHLISSSRLELSLKLEVARILLSHGADVDAEEEEGMTPAQVASARGEAELVQLFSENCFK